jgi:inhibitor of KinA sporulation pathway (predicted exonuclease)
VTSTQSIRQVLSSAHVIVIDLEYTAWEGSLEANWGRPGEFREIVQIGAIKLETASLGEVSSFNRLVRPQINPTLSEYFVRLTGITNDQISKHGCTIEKALKVWLNFARDTPVYSWGDENPVFADNLRLLGYENLVLPHITDLRPILIAAAPELQNATSGQLAALLGSRLRFRAHDAIEDCRSIAEALRILAT